jgi:plasmid stability protein
MRFMRQLITRVDDDLHARLRQRAAEEGRSVNSLVNDILAAAVAGGDRRAALRMRARATGRLVLPPQPAKVPSHQVVERATRGSGLAASEALTAERAAG